MEQMSFDILPRHTDAITKEYAVFQAIKPYIDSTLAEDNFPAKSAYFRAGDAKQSQYSSVYLVNDGNLLCRISFRGKNQYLSVSSCYRKFLPDNTKYKVLPSEPGYCRISFSTIDDVMKYINTLCKIVSEQLNSLPVEFGCCSRYEVCSDELKCIHPDPSMAIKCAYRRNLKQGKIFYGKNKTV